MLADSLRDFLGPSALAAEAWLARIEHPKRGGETVILPPLPDPPVREVRRSASGGVQTAGGEDADVPDDETGEITSQQTGEDTGEQTAVDDGLATEAGMPIFHEDTDEVTWLRHHTEKPPPPPAIEPPPERPLFAPDPEDGQPVRRPRAAPVGHGPGNGGFWPWDTGAGATSGSGVLPAYVDEDEDDNRHAPGTNMLRLAGIIAASLLVLVACVIAFNLGRGKTPLGSTKDESSQGPSHTPSSSGAPAAAAITGVTARDFDPQGSGDENPGEAPLAVDHDPSTAWTTLRYDQQFGAGGLKTGVGLVLDLHRSYGVSEVDLTTVGAPTGVSIYVSPTDPSSLSGLDVAGRSDLTGTRGTVSLDQPVTGRYVVVWLTKLPPVAGGFRGGVADAVVKGA
jgi:hypothetical protein